MIRAVLDTNVVISALILQGPTNQLVDLWQQRKFKFLVSKEIVSEYLRVLAYPKFALSREEIQALFERELVPYMDLVEVTDVPKVIKEDPSDNIFLACAKTGKCQYLVSGDHHLLDLKQYGKIPIVSISAFLASL